MQLWPYSAGSKSAAKGSGRQKVEKKKNLNI